MEKSFTNEFNRSEYCRSCSLELQKQGQAGLSYSFGVEMVNLSTFYSNITTFNHNLH